MLCGVVAMTGGEAAKPATTVTAPPAAAAAAVTAGPVVVRDASGTRTRPMASAALLVRPLVITVPTRYAGQPANLVLWRRLADRREATPWISATAPVRGDGTLPIAGLAAGSYDFVVTFGDGGTAATFAANRVQVPGEVVLGDLPAR